MFEYHPISSLINVLENRYFKQHTIHIDIIYFDLYIKKNIITTLQNRLISYIYDDDQNKIAFYNLNHLLDIIKTREDRMCLERIFVVLFHKENENLINTPSLFGYPIFNVTYDDYKKGLDWGDIKMVKVFTGR